MARWSDIAVWEGPTPNQSGPMQEQRGLVLHIMQGSYAGSISWGKNPASSVSFHFATRADGHIGQLVDTDVTAWTQGNGNGRWISVENEGFSGNPLTDGQVEACAQIYARGVREYGWPLQATDSPNGFGLGWHGMGGTAWGGHPDCPGEPIKDQRGAILARAHQILGGDDMASEWHTGDENGPALTQGTAGYAGQQRDTALAFAWQAAAEARALAEQAVAGIAELKTLIQGLPGGGTGGGLTFDQAKQAAFEGAQRAENE